MKLGPHAILASQAVIQWAQRAPITKALNPMVLSQAQPGAVTVYRCYFDDEEQAALNVDYVVNKIMGRLAGFKPTFVELLNETHQRIAWGLADYTAFTKQCVDRFHSIDQLVAGFSFSVGQPEMEDWQFLAAYDPPFAGVDAIVLHEYWNGSTGNFSTWCALRYRRVHDILGGQHPPFIIGEAGADQVEGGQAGWKKCGISGAAYMGQVASYGGEADKDPYVIGVTPYSGAVTPDWSNFDTDGDCHLIPGGAPQPIQFWIPRGGPHVFEFTLGFKDYHDAHPDLVGAATSDLMYDANGTAVQYTEKGRLEWNKASNQTLFFAAAVPN